MSNNIQPTRRRDLYVYLLVILAMPFYIWCLLNHWCMCGHLQHEAPTIIQLINDSIWVTFIVAAAVFSFQSTIPYKIAFSIALLFLVALADLLVVPVLIWILVKSIVGFINALSHRITSIKTEKIIIAISFVTLILLIALFLYLVVMKH